MLLLLLLLVLLVAAVKVLPIAAVVVAVAVVAVAVDLLRSRLYLKVVANSAICVVDSSAAAGVLIMRLRTLSTGRRDTFAVTAAAPATEAALVDVAAAGEAAVCVRSWQTQVDHPRRRSKSR